LRSSIEEKDTYYCNQREFLQISLVIMRYLATASAVSDSINESASGILLAAHDSLELAVTGGGGA
jgi:hypothetical protein